MAKRNKGIIAYGTDEDRKKLAILASLTNRSASDWIIEEIRGEWQEAFGDAPAECISTQQ